MTATYLGRRPAPLQKGGAVAVELLDLHLDETTIDSYERLAFTAEILVRDPERIGSLKVSVSLPLLDPDLIIAAVDTALNPKIGTVGRYRLFGTTSKIPLRGGRLSLTISVLDTHTVPLVRDAIEFAMHGSPGAVKPSYALAASALLTPTRKAPLKSNARPHHPTGPPTLKAVDVAKSFRVRDGSASGHYLRWSRWSVLTVLDGVDLRVQQGEVLGLVGANGTVGCVGTRGGRF